jgi:hypothetical protein
LSKFHKNLLLTYSKDGGSSETSTIHSKLIYGFSTIEHLPYRENIPLVKVGSFYAQSIKEKAKTNMVQCPYIYKVSPPDVTSCTGTCSITGPDWFLFTLTSGGLPNTIVQFVTQKAY